MDSSAVVPPAPAQASATTSSALRAELAALDAVRSTLANDDPAGALSFLAAYFRTFPRGRLRYEADVLRIAALAQAGQRDTARRYALKFLKRHPNSVLTARVRPYAEQ
jgi:outer membrane protein assembly factor BamD (BamD/ComL family)